MTTQEAAKYPGDSAERVMIWASDGRPPEAARAENGDTLFRQHVLDDIGETLAACAPVKYDHRRRSATNREHRSAPLRCGCAPTRSPLHLCRTGTSLLAAVQMAEWFLADAPGDRLFERLVDLARDALTRHLAHGEPITPVDPGHIKGSPLRHSAPLALPAPSPNSHATPHEDATRLK